MSLDPNTLVPHPEEFKILIYKGETYEKDKKDNLSLKRE
jgi:hypothetical protein